MHMMVEVAITEGSPEATITHQVRLRATVIAAGMAEGFTEGMAVAGIVGIITEDRYQGARWSVVSLAEQSSVVCMVRFGGHSMRCQRPLGIMIHTTPPHTQRPGTCLLSLHQKQRLPSFDRHLQLRLPTSVMPLRLTRGET
jgi:hypothetical protein